MNSVDFDKFLSENLTKPEWIFVHPKIWSGYWSIKKIPNKIRIMFKYLGKFMRNKHLFWVGLPLYWVTGIKELLPDYIRLGYLDER